MAHTSPRTRRAYLWLSPGLVVTVAAVYAVVALQGGQHIRRQAIGPPAAAASSAPPPAYTIAGNIRLNAGQYVRQGKSCRGTHVSADAQVVATDARGASLAYAPLNAGKLVDGHCDLPFTVQLPAGKATYGLDIPTWGMASYSEQEIANTISLTYG